MTNVAVDPLAEFGLTETRPLVRPARRAKTRMVVEGSAASASTFILGSSRSMKVEPGYVEELTGRVAFNAAVNLAGAEDYFAMLQFLLEHAEPKTLIVGVDEIAFHETTGIDVRLVGAPRLARHLDASDRVRGAWDQFEAALGFGTLVATAKSLRFMAIGYPDDKFRFQEDGLLTYLDREEQIATGTYDFPAEQAKSNVEYDSTRRTWPLASLGTNLGLLVLQVHRVPHADDQ